MSVPRSTYADGWYTSLDGLRLHYRDYPGPASRPALLCLGGLTRNARDFAGLAERLNGAWRVIALDLRGRGESAHARDPLTYVPLTYLQDIGAALTDAGVDRFVVLGTGLGGVLALLLTVTQRSGFAGAILNDVGPQPRPGGAAGGRAETVRGGNWPTWIHAARDLAQTYAATYPGWTTADWLAFAKRVAKLSTAGRIGLDHDARITAPFRLPGGDTGLDLWPAFAGLSGVPCLSLRGGLSETLSPDTHLAMATLMPGLRRATIPGVGHAPTLDEPEAVAAIDALLAEVAGL